MKRFMILMTALFLFSSPALADERKEIPEYLQKKYDRRAEEMKGFDKNKDGILQAGELQGSVQTKFSAADTNKDGILSPEETAASLEKFKTQKTGSYGEAVAKQQANRMKNRFNNADANRDGQVSKEEYSAYMAKHQQNFDRNGDGVISEEEYRTDGEKLPSSYMKPPKKED
jgi:Ca2+-binding EF-hand superfamily protein